MLITILVLFTLALMWMALMEGSNDD